jgi:small GTP-binding protein
MRFEGCDAPRECKIVILGSTLVGKTSLASRLTGDSFSPNTTPTVLTSFLAHSVTVGDVELKLQIWDTGGSEKYRAMVPMYFQHADAAIIVYDITSRDSFDDINFWFKELQDKGPESVFVVLAGNKCDLESMRKVTTEEGRAIAAKFGIHVFMETSAVTKKNVAELFFEAGKGILGAASLAEANARTWPSSASEKTGWCC